MGRKHQLILTYFTLRILLAHHLNHRISRYHAPVLVVATAGRQKAGNAQDLIRCHNYPITFLGQPLAYLIWRWSTVHTGIALVTGTEDRHWLYPAMTRGTNTNLAFVFTTPPKPADPQPGTRTPPELDRYERIRRERDGFLPARRPSRRPDRPRAHPGHARSASRLARSLPRPRPGRPA
jgi:hypothetical protein